MENKIEYKLTQFAHGAGCGCKLSPGKLGELLQVMKGNQRNELLLRGYENSDDAAVFQITQELSLVSTADFFMPIVDDALLFGKISACNALSDVYAMGAKPVLALAILGWPENVLPMSVAAEVLRGASEICNQAGVSLGGGHSIDNPEPIFGLTVNGLVNTKSFRANDMANASCSIYYSKPLGIGLASTLAKGNTIHGIPENVIKAMLSLNDEGVHLASLSYVKTMTDVSGFGLAGHLLEVCNASGINAVIEYSQLRVFDEVSKYIYPFLVPKATNTNRSALGELVSFKEENQFVIVCDPQTSGGLLVFIERGFEKEFELEMKQLDKHYVRIGYTCQQEMGVRIRVQ